MNPARWTVRSINGRWTALPPWPIDQHRSFARWEDAYRFADAMARGLA